MSKREVIQPHGADKRYARRDALGRFTADQVDVGASLTADRKRRAEHESKHGQGDRGDRQGPKLR